MANVLQHVLAFLTNSFGFLMHLGGRDALLYHTSFLRIRNMRKKQNKRNFLIISDFVGVLHCVFHRSINALKGQQAHSVGQRPTKEI
ncbi:MAG: hypothetical protein LBQ66_03885, partial [Planctomycetaceae bacterium]|nr:hypothetical protein [Planctomycetaceae bacterium]